MQGKRTWAEIDLDALKSNVLKLKATIKSGEMMAVVKADAYGHGAAVITPMLEKWGVNNFAVATIEEAEELRRVGALGNILILGYTDTDLAFSLYENNINQAVFSLSYAKALNASAKKSGIKIPVSIKLDTGMGRIGFNCTTKDDIAKSTLEIAEVCKLNNLIVNGCFTHFAVADSEEENNKAYTNVQANLFLSAVAEIKAKTGKELKIHCNNSAGALYYPEMQLNYSRIGISLYGLTPDPALNLPIKLEPVMSFKTVISQIKQLEKGKTVSYGRTFKAEEDITVATIPVGYADGLHRALSNKGYVLVNGKKAKIIGRVCMDQTMIDITGIKAKEGDIVEIFGKNLPCNELAGVIDTINYELVCSVSRRIPRIYFKQNKIVRIENYVAD